MFGHRSISAQSKKHGKVLLQITTLAHNVLGQALMFLGDIRVVPVPNYSQFNCFINPLTQYCAGDKIEKNEMGWACGAYG